ncbi:hypothetical protein GQ43DRAFT_97722 [Delitschia confertaspora ATCC 74209]|uniref:Uncharacterized protein n=1 Tax=Delitschia confertaspora ATCC 74209 TaxID=1513339 RepID=A0A9P4JNW9_9PLEO|nr:hypothetical protein GQ43DRAFT_97722 [Delitschia confertaspora ATCC 74209]
MQTSDAFVCMYIFTFLFLKGAVWPYILRQHENEERDGEHVKAYTNFAEPIQKAAYVSKSGNLLEGILQ